MTSRMRIAAVLAVAIAVFAVMGYVWSPKVSSGQSLEHSRWMQAYDDTVSRFGLNSAEWVLLGLDDLVKRDPFELAAKPKSPQSNDIYLIIDHILTDYHKVGDVLPVFLLSPDGRTLLVAFKCFESGEVRLVTARLVEDDWEVTALSER